MATPFVVPFSRISLDMLPLVGGKNASLGELIRGVSAAGVAVPDGFALTVDAFREHLARAGIEQEIVRRLDALDVKDVSALAETAADLRQLIASAPLPERVAQETRAAYEALSRGYGEDATDVAVRSSATAEDLPTASFAGQQETFLNVRGWPALDRAVRDCMASLYTDRAIVYRAGAGIEHGAALLSVGVQKMVRSDLGAAGVLFTLDTESGFRDVVLITGSWGLGEVVVQGRVNPDEYWVHKPGLLEGHRALIRRELGSKALKMVYGDGRAVREVRTTREERARFVLSEEEALRLARWGLLIEEHYGERAGRPTPMDVEWAKDGRTGALYVVQARPETVHAHAGPASLELFRLKGKGRLLIEGKSVGRRVGSGPVRIVRGPADLEAFQEGEVLVAAMTDPDWEPVLGRAAAVVTDQGGRTCHAAIVSRELGLPCVVGAGAATAVLHGGQVVTVCCAEGDIGRVYEGEVPFTRESVSPETLPATRVPLMLNVASPEQAFQLGQLPCAGVGLMRIEFLVSHWIGIHPMAVCHPERVLKDQQRAEILRRTHGEDPKDYFVERMASGVATIAAAFHPRPVLVRFSDFKSNEYARLLGGEFFEPHEANPMIGFRGASRYYDERYREGFELECAAIARVRNEMGLRNVRVMIPFCRTLAEGRAVLEAMAVAGLPRGENGLQVWVMCEIPNNVILADGFSALFDGFSIGSNDLTQLTLGVDRHSDLLAHVFDERDPGVRRMIEMVIRTAHEHGREVGLCGQAPSDHPEFAEWLAAAGIDSISLTPDSLPGVARRLAKAEARAPAAKTEAETEAEIGSSASAASA